MHADLVIPAAHPDIVQSYTIGYSFEDRPLIVARLTNRAIAGDKPVPFVMGGIHGREMATVEGVMAIRREPTADRHKGGTHARIDRRPAFGPVQAPAL